MVKYAVDNFVVRVRVGALLEQLAVAVEPAPVLLRWLPAHRDAGRGGWESDCNDQSGGQDAFLFFTVNAVAWMMAPFRFTC